MTHRNGHHPACEPELVGRLCDLLTACPDLSSACSKLGLARRTVYVWFEHAEQGDEPYVTQCDRITEARQVYKRELLAQVRELRRSGTKNDATKAKMLVWELEKHFPEDYGSRAKLEVSGPGGGPLNVAGPTLFLPMPADDDAR